MYRIRVSSTGFGYLKRISNTRESFSTTLLSTMKFYDLLDRGMDGNVVPMSKYRGNVLLVVNVASK